MRHSATHRYACLQTTKKYNIRMKVKVKGINKVLKSSRYLQCCYIHTIYLKYLWNYSRNRLLYRNKIVNILFFCFFLSISFLFFKPNLLVALLCTYWCNVMRFVGVEYCYGPTWSSPSFRKTWRSRTTHY